MLRFRMGLIDIRGAYMQSGKIHLRIYASPWSEWDSKRGGYVGTL